MNHIERSHSARTEIPRYRVLRVAEAAERLGVSRTTLWRWWTSGHFPAPRQLGLTADCPIRGWLETEIDQWLGELRMYLYAKLLWNPDYDVFAGIAEYCTHAYGAAGEMMHRYLRSVGKP